MPQTTVLRELQSGEASKKKEKMKKERASERARGVCGESESERDGRKKEKKKEEAPRIKEKKAQRTRAGVASRRVVTTTTTRRFDDFACHKIVVPSAPPPLASFPLLESRALVLVLDTAASTSPFGRPGPND